jgi:hypothetical protein
MTIITPKGYKLFFILKIDKGIYMHSPTKNNNSFKSMNFATETSISRQMEMAEKLGFLTSQTTKVPKDHPKDYPKEQKQEVFNTFSKDSYEKTVIRERNNFIEENFGKELACHFKCLEREAFLIKKCFYEAQFNIPNHFDSAKIEQMLCAYFENLGYKTKVRDLTFGSENSSAGGVVYDTFSTRKKPVPSLREATRNDQKTESDNNIISIILS